ncbi:hypothetical protein [Radiobacillus deserti]|uniref:Uncharacterized protein n=1 Tax=Radiobacillus deserti TaxID=2594883 RepID=A0A516KG24_9BACI|nr:hypothetical protein [Radiobacillus deserti]QDP40353.1 hypothetical protein FN924_09290 [Radiobacillus deserti]
MEQDEWILNELQKVFERTNDYNHRVLIKATQDMLKEQQRRIYQMENEMEGTIWSPRRWGE